MKKVKTDSELLCELSFHITKSLELLDMLKIREALLAINCSDGKKKRRK